MTTEIVLGIEDVAADGALVLALRLPSPVGLVRLRSGRGLPFVGHRPGSTASVCTRKSPIGGRTFARRPTRRVGP